MAPDRPHPSGRPHTPGPPGAAPGPAAFSRIGDFAMTVTKSSPRPNTHFMDTDARALASYLGSTYYPVAVLVPDAPGAWKTSTSHAEEAHMSITEETTQNHRPDAILARNRALFEPALHAAIDRLPAAVRPAVTYHFGHHDEYGAPTHTTSGKAIRPALVLLAAEAVGGTPAAAVPAAVAVELVHNFSLLHDDVMDGDTTRRHRPTAWTVFGANTAILAGNALLTLAMDVLAADGHGASRDGLRMLSSTVFDLVNGQQNDLDFERRWDVDLDECVRMAEDKTSALLGHACAVGATFGGGKDRVEPLREFGRSFGTAFQHIDDLLGIWGRPDITGKPIHSDLRSRKKSLPVVAALTSKTPSGNTLADLYLNDRELSEADLVRAAELVEAAGGRRWSQEQADTLLDRALDVLCSTDLAPRPAEELRALARFAVHRTH